MSKAVKKIALVAAGAALGFVTGGVGFALIGGAVGLFVGAQQDAALKGGGTSSEPSAQTVRSSKAPARYVLGRVSTGGVLVWAQEQAGGQGDGEWVHLVYVLSEGAIDALESIYLGEEDIGTYGSFATYELVINPIQVNAFLKANCRDWKDAQIGRGLSFVRLSLKHNAEKFPSGIPDVRFVVRGRNDIYDPRTGTTLYSANTALHMLWYLRNRCKVPDDEIVFETFASAANVCDEAVTNADGSTSQRYRTGCVIGADEQRTQVIQKLEESCAGQLIRVGGKWMLQVGAYYGPYDFEITEDMVIGTVSGSTEVNNDSAINIVTGTFIDPSQAWAETDFPEVRIEGWVTEDGGEASESMSLGYVSDAYQGQRLANIKLRRQRAGGSLQIPMNFQGYNCRPGRVVRVNLPSLNIVGEFIVTDWSMASDDGCTVTVSQYEAAIFDDAVGQPYNPLGFISLPSGGLGTPTAVTWTQDDTAEVTQGVLSWTAPAGIVTGYAVTVRQGSIAVQAQQVPATTAQLPLAGLPSGNYTMAVAAIGPLTRSGEATITVNIDGPPVPEACTVQASIDSIVLVPSNPLHGLNGGTYEYFFTMDPKASAEKAQYLGQGLSFTHTGLAFYTNYYYFIRARNAYGANGFLKVPAATSNDVSAFLAALGGKIGQTELSKELNDKIGEIDGLKEQIDALDGLKAYQGNQPYLKGAMVVSGDRIFQASKDVPANTPPPNANYWDDVGQSLQTAAGLAQQLEQNSAAITDVQAEVKSTQTLRAAYRADSGDGELQDALKAWNTQASYAKEVSVRAAQDQALVQTTEVLKAGVNSNDAKITNVQRVVADNQSATAQQISQLQASVGGNTSAIQTVSQTVASLDGKVSATHTIKVQASLNGAYEVAGIGLGVDNASGVLQSNIIFRANQFAFASPNGDGSVSYPYIISGGANYFNTAFFQDASISFLKVGDNVQSTNFVAGQSGWRLAKDGTFEINSALGGGGRQIINSYGGKVYDANGVKRYQWGNLDA